MKTYMDVISTLHNLNEKCADAKSCYDDAKKILIVLKGSDFLKQTLNAWKIYATKLLMFGKNQMKKLIVLFCRIGN